MEELELRHWLNRAFYADKKAKALDMLVRRCRERATGLTGASEGNDKGKSDSAKNGTENALMQLAEMERKAKEQEDMAIKAAAEIQDAITKLQDDDLEAVLINRYLNFLTAEQTAEAMNYTSRTIKSKTKKAITKLSTVFHCNSPS